MLRAAIREEVGGEAADTLAVHILRLADGRQYDGVADAVDEHLFGVKPEFLGDAYSLAPAAGKDLCSLHIDTSDRRFLNSVYSMIYLLSRKRMTRGA